MSAPTITAPATASGGVPVGGSGAAGYLAKWTAATTLGGSTTTGTTASPYVDATGQIGIGTASPYEKLSVRASAGGGVGVWSTSATSAGSLIGGSLFLGDDNFYNAGFYNKSPGLSAVFDAAYNASAALAFYTYNYSRTERMRIDATGNVGIGTASPSSLGANYTTLDIRGSSGGGIKFGNATQYAYMYSDSSGFALSTQTNLPLNFYTNNAVLRASVGSTSLDISATSNYGLKLQSTPGNTDPNTLDCYAESTYTAADNSGAGLAFTVNNVAVVTRVGRLVSVRVDITFPVTASAAYASISVPFTSITNGGSGTSLAGAIGTCLVLANAASFEVYASAPITRQTNANLSGVRLVFSLTYQAA
jgi:hypothetical protein